ncbi:MAG TPA: helicase-related protein, partial [Hyphomicrobiales bacterium]|nr:helicase-related protein [Hyphomicrobiales bacterium]
MLPAAARGRSVTALLGPTNTGKTHLAIERMVAQPSGLIGLPLRLLAREVYARVVAKVGADAVALVTGEEKIKPPSPRFWVSTVEAMPQDLAVDFVAIDEVQLAADLDRGHVFTDRMLNRRGRFETLLLGAATIRPLVEKLIPGANIIGRPRLSTLTFAGERKITRLPPRSAIVAFSADEVYAIAELVRRNRGGAAVVLGALSPRTRNAQVELYQSGEVDYLVATDAIGMGLNLDLDHVAFAADRKFDGFQFRRLNAGEFGQIAGRAGRHLRNGTFGTTGRCPPLEDELVQRLESHDFEPVRTLQWRNADLDFASLAALQESLAATPQEEGLTRALPGDDVSALDHAARDADIRALASSPAQVARLWEVCQVPDYRKVAPAAHAELVATLYGYLAREGTVPTDWFAAQVKRGERTDGDIDTLAARIAHARTWAFVANRADWLADPEEWQGITREVEDRLSDALHERLTQRFVDRRTSVLMRRLREKEMLDAEITPSGDVVVEGQHLGSLLGFRFTPDATAQESEGKALRAAAQNVLSGELEARSERLAAAPDADIVLASGGMLRWRGEPVGRLIAGERLLAPQVRLLADDTLSVPARERAEGRLALWVATHIKRLLGALAELEAAAEITGVARGIAYQLVEGLGVLERSAVAAEAKSLGQPERAALRKHGVRFGAYHIFLPALLKPAPRSLAAQLWALQQGSMEIKGLDELPRLAASGRTSFASDPEVPQALLAMLGFRGIGPRALRIDILERLADLIRAAIAYRPGASEGTPPPGAAEGNGFTVTPAMTSIAGCAGDDFAAVLRALGYRSEKRPAPPPTPAAPRAEATAPDAAAEPAAAESQAEPEEVFADATEGRALSEAAAEEPAGAETAASEADAELAGDPIAAEPAAADPAIEITVVEEDAAEPGATADAAPEPEVAAEASAVPAEAAMNSAEPEFIEIWRPARHEPRRPPRESRPRPQQGHRRPPRRPAAAAAGADPATATAAGGAPAE